MKYWFKRYTACVVIQALLVLGLPLGSAQAFDTSRSYLKQFTYETLEDPRGISGILSLVRKALIARLKGRPLPAWTNNAFEKVSVTPDGLLFQPHHTQQEILATTIEQPNQGDGMSFPLPSGETAFVYAVQDQIEGDGVSVQSVQDVNPYILPEFVLGTGYLDEDAAFNGRISKEIEDRIKRGKVRMLVIGPGAGRLIYEMQHRYPNNVELVFMNKTTVDASKETFIQKVLHGQATPEDEVEVERFLDAFREHVILYDVEEGLRKGLQEASEDRAFDMILLAHATLPYVQNKYELLRDIQDMLTEGGIAFINLAKTFDLRAEHGQETPSMLVSNALNSIGSPNQYEYNPFGDNHTLIITNIDSSLPFPQLNLLSSNSVDTRLRDGSERELPAQFHNTYALLNYNPPGYSAQRSDGLTFLKSKAPSKQPNILTETKQKGDGIQKPNHHSPSDRAWWKKYREGDYESRYLPSSGERLVRIRFRGLLPIESNILELFSGHTSYIPDDLDPARIVGVDVNPDALRNNPRLTSSIVQDLNTEPRLHDLADDEFDAIVMVLGVPYAEQPFVVFKEAARLLQPGGIFIVVFREYSTPLVTTHLWRNLTDDQRIGLVKLSFEQASFTNIQLQENEFTWDDVEGKPEVEKLRFVWGYMPPLSEPVQGDGLLDSSAMTEPISAQPFTVQKTTREQAALAIAHASTEILPPTEGLVSVRLLSPGEKGATRRVGDSLLEVVHKDWRLNEEQPDVVDLEKLDAVGDGLGITIHLFLEPSSLSWTGEDKSSIRVLRRSVLQSLRGFQDFISRAGNGLSKLQKTLLEEVLLWLQA